MIIRSVHLTMSTWSFQVQSLPDDFFFLTLDFFKDSEAPSSISGGSSPPPPLTVANFLKYFNTKISRERCSQSFLQNLLKIFLKTVSQFDVTFCQTIIIIITEDRSPGLVVIGGDSCSKSHEFESLHCILDGHFFTHLLLLSL